MDTTTLVHTLQTIWTVAENQRSCRKPQKHKNRCTRQSQDSNQQPRRCKANVLTPKMKNTHESKLFMKKVTFCRPLNLCCTVSTDRLYTILRRRYSPLQMDAMRRCYYIKSLENKIK